MNIYVIYDKRAKTYESPMFLQTDVHAIRGFTQVIEQGDANNNIAKYPSDFVVIRVGTFDQDDGQIYGTEHEIIADGEKIAAKLNEEN